MIRASKPLLKIPDCAVCQRHRRFRTLAQIGSQRLNARDVLVIIFFQAGKALKAIGVDGRAWDHILLDKIIERRGLKVWDYSHADPTRSLSALFNSYKHQRNGTNKDGQTAKPSSAYTVGRKRAE